MNTKQQVEQVKVNLQKMIEEREIEKLVKTYQYAIYKTIAEKFPQKEVKYIEGTTISLPDVLEGKICVISY